MEFGQWQQGSGARYEARVGEALWYDQGQYHGRAPVEIRDRTTSEVLSRVGDVRIIGNFSPIFVNLLGHRVQLDEVLTWNGTVEEELARKSSNARMKKAGIQDRSPKDWIPPAQRKGAPRKGRSLGHSMGASWGVGPFDTDGAAEVLAEAQASLISLIGARFEPGTRTPNDEIVAAAALLHYLTDESAYPNPLDLTHLALVLGIFALGVAALDSVLEDKDWLSLWPEPHRKHTAVRALRDALEQKAVTQGENER